MKVVTFNIRYDGANDGKNSFCYRSPLIMKKIKAEMPDIICFQEVLDHVAAWLKQNLTDYYVIGCPRCDDLTGEQVSIAYKRDRFNLMKMDTYWLSPTPFVPGSRYEEQSICPRVCTEAVFQDLKTKKVFRVANTHLDHEGDEARTKGLRQIMEHLKAEVFFADVPTIVTGDMNAYPDSRTIEVMNSYPGFYNATEGIGITYHGYGCTNQGCIDYIFVKDWIVENAAVTWKDEEDGVLLSDHYPVCVVLKDN